MQEQTLETTDVTWCLLDKQERLNGGAFSPTTSQYAAPVWGVRFLQNKAANSTDVSGRHCFSNESVMGTDHVIDAFIVCILFIPLTSSSQREHALQTSAVAVKLEVKPLVCSPLSVEALMIRSIAPSRQDFIWWDFFCLGFISYWWPQTREGLCALSCCQPPWLTLAPAYVSEVM